MLTAINGVSLFHLYKQNIIISYMKLYFAGVVAFDDKTGFWLIHSVPNFPDHREYEYPETATNNGQTAICVTFKTSQLNEIGKFVFYIVFYNSKRCRLNSAYDKNYR